MSQAAQEASLGLYFLAMLMAQLTPSRQAADTPTTPGFSPSQGAKDSHAVGDAPQAELVLYRQQSGATSHAIVLNSVGLDEKVASHAAASLAAGPRTEIQTDSMVAHV